MDCEKLEAAMMDELYGELDEVTSAAVKRHLAGCARCSALLSGLKATRRLAAISLVTPPAGLEGRVLLAARAARPATPPRRRLASAISLAGSWAMRPQTAMAALFLVMIGTSVLLLRGRSSRAPASAEITVTEEGTPAPVAAAPTPPEPMASEIQPAALPAAVARARPAEQKIEQRSAAAPAPQPAAPAAPAARTDDAVGESSSAFALAPAPTSAPMAAARPAAGGGAFGAGGAAAAMSNAAPPPAAKAAEASAPADPALDLRIARSIRDTRGCRAALAKFDQVAQQAAGTRTGWDALLDGAKCHAATGDVAGARARLNTLLEVDLYRDAARAQLDKLDRGY